MNSQPEDRKQNLAELAIKVGEEISKEIDDLEERAAKLEGERQQFEREKSSLRALQAKGGDVLKLNVGGRIFAKKSCLREKYRNI